MHTIHYCNTQGFPALFNMKQNEIQLLSCCSLFHPAVRKFSFNRLTLFLIEIVCVCVCSGISCMAQDCSLQMPEDFVLPLLPAEELKDKYRRYLFRDYVEVCVCGICLASECQGSAVTATERWERWERCENAAVFLSRSESPSHFPTISQFSTDIHVTSLTQRRQQSDHNTINVQLRFIPWCTGWKTMRFSLGLTSVCFVFQSHFQLQLCPGADCPIVIKVQEPRARRVQCSRCSEVFW